MDVKELKKVGLIELKPSGRAKRVELKYNHIIIEFRLFHSSLFLETLPLTS